MKTHHVLISFFLVLSFQSTAQIRSNKDLIGKWTASGLKLEFMPDGRVMFTMRGGSVPGARYKTNFMLIPAVLEIELVQKAEKVVYKSTVEFLNNDSFRLTALDTDLARSFDKQRSVILKREK